jgi:GxxExxY protein
MPLSELDPALTEMSRRVIGCAIEVHKALGPGFSRDIYANALDAALKTDGIEYSIDHDFEVRFGDRVVGQARADMYVAKRFLVKIMADQREVRSHERTELRAQLRAADSELGLIINFGERRLKDGLVRVLNPDKLAAMRAAAEGDDEEYEDDDEEYEDDDEYEDEDEEESN